jgi:hypothetical protein
VNEEKNAFRANAVHRRTRAAKDKYRQARSKERNLFKEKSRQLDEEALIVIERHRSIQDSRKFYKRLNDVKRLERDQPPDQVDLRANGVEIDLPSREEIESTLNYLKK